MLAALALGGCTTRGVDAGDDAARRRMLTLLVPRKIEIVAPFTGVKSFDDDPTPDGIELLLQAVNSLDDPGMLVGHVRVELFEQVPATADPKGRRLEHWNIELTTMNQQRTFWNAATQMYEFRLQADPEVIPPRDRYVLQVTYASPLGEHLTAEHAFEYGTALRAWRGAQDKSGPAAPSLD